jgi:aspartyl-tRNA(Asn)/glutamyl-tRNA(Gln) amidotransferase subunit C
LDLGPEERSRMQEELSHILEHAEKIQVLDLDGVEPTSHAIPITNALRADGVEPSLAQSEALANAPDAEDGRFKVPRIIEDAG